MPRRKPPMPFADYVRGLDLDPSIMTKGNSAKDDAAEIPHDLKLSSLLADDRAGPSPKPAIATVTDFTKAMLEAGKPHT